MLYFFMGQNPSSLEYAQKNGLPKLRTCIKSKILSSFLNRRTYYYCALCHKMTCSKIE